jgi:hypothetical protein
MSWITHALFTRPPAICTVGRRRVRTPVGHHMTCVCVCFALLLICICTLPGRARVRTLVCVRCYLASDGMIKRNALHIRARVCPARVH